MIPIGSMVALSYYKRDDPRPIGIVLGHKEIFNMVKWINKDEHSHYEGGYFDASLVVLNEVKADGS